ncbi:MAG: lytic transglycosylase domain-containing protein [Granulosicoccus sp.]
MIPTTKQKTGVADTACVVMLCMASTMLLGFSSPKKFKQPVETLDSPAPVVVDKVISLAEPVPQVIDVKVPEVLTRPASLAGNYPFGSVLGGVHSRTWLHKTVDGTDRLVNEEQAASSGTFHGVGFPDIRTHERRKRSPFDAPGPWAPLVAWRTAHGEHSDREPIARVRCMGLTPQAVARRADRYRELIYAYADKYEVSRHLVKAVITEESCFNNKALSPVGAQGLMQLMPETASWLKVQDVHDPAQNVRAGVRYLASLQKQFDTVELALAAYNAGPGNVRRYKGIPPFAETRAYVVKVQSHYRRYQAAHNMLYPVEDIPEQAANSLLVP